MTKQRRDLYDILDVSPTASLPEIKKKYRSLAKQYHPDAHADNPDSRDWAHQKMAELNEAYDTLKDPVKRAQYDWQRRIFVPPPSAPAPEPWSAQPFGSYSTSPPKDDPLLALYKRGLHRFREMKWAEALEIFRQIQDVDPNYRDVVGRIRKAEQIVSRQEREERLTQAYRDATQYFGTQHWAEAIEALEMVQQIDPDYKDTAQKLKAARTYRRRDKLYDDALNFIEREKWLEAIVHLEALLNEDASYPQAAEHLQQAQDKYLASRLPEPEPEPETPEVSVVEEPDSPTVLEAEVEVLPSDSPTVETEPVRLDSELDPELDPEAEDLAWFAGSAEDSVKAWHEVSVDDSELESQAQAKLDIESDIEPDIESEIEPILADTLEPEPEPSPISKPIPSETETAAEAVSKAEAETQAETESENQPEAIAETQLPTPAESLTQPELEIEIETEIEIEAEPESGFQPEPEPDSLTELEALEADQPAPASVEASSVDIDIDIEADIETDVEAETIQRAAQDTIGTAPIRRDPRLLFEAGLEQYYRHNWPEARHKFSAALHINSDYADAHACLGWIYRQQGQYEAALKQAEIALSLDVDCVYAYVGLGDVYYEQKQMKAAIEAYEQAVMLDAKWDWLRTKIARLYTEQGELQAAIFQYEALLVGQTEAKSQAQTYYRLGRLWEQLGNLEAAGAAYQKAARLAPDLPRAYFALAQIYQRQGRNEAASSAYKTFLTQSENQTERRPRRQSVWHLGMLAMAPFQHWVLATLIWGPALLITSGVSMSATVGLALGFVLNLLVVRYHLPPRWSDTQRYAFVGVLSGGGFLAGLLLAFSYFLGLTPTDTLSASLMLMMALIMCTLTSKVMYEMREPAYQLAWGISLGLVAGSLVAFSLRIETASLLESFGWAAIFLAFGGLGLVVMVSGFMLLVNWLVDRFVPYVYE